MISFLLEYGADPNCVVEGIAVWRQFLKDSLLKLNFEFKTNEWHQVFHLLLHHGANFKQQTDIWMKFLAKWGTKLSFDNGIARSTLRIFTTLFTRKLDPNARSNNDSIWVLFLRVAMPVFSNGGCALIRNQLLQEFLRRGADVTQIYSAPGISWFEHILNHIRSCVLPLDPSSEFEIMLQHSLDPHAQIRGQTLWERLLNAMQEGSPEYHQGPPVDYKYNMYYKIIVVFLRYGADPYSENLYILKSWQRCGKPIFTHNQLGELAEIVQKEQRHLKSQKQSSASISLQPKTTRPVHPQHGGKQGLVDMDHRRHGLDVPGLNRSTEGQTQRKSVLIDIPGVQSVIGSTNIVTRRKRDWDTSFSVPGEESSMSNNKRNGLGWQL